MKNILIIDDDATFKLIMKDLFGDAGYTVVLAGDGEDGLSKIEATIPDLILLDVNMAKMGGMEFLKKMNETYGAGKIPVLMTSNMSDMETITEGVVLGVQGYVVKSDESAQGILDAVERILKTKTDRT